MDGAWIHLQYTFRVGSSVYALYVHTAPIMGRVQKIVDNNLCIPSPYKFTSIGQSAHCSEDFISLHSSIYSARRLSASTHLPTYTRVHV